MITIAVTGGIATGKTTICYLIKQIGIKTINSDNVIKKIYEKNSSINNKIKKNYPFLFNTKNKLDLIKLSDEAFHNRELLCFLENITYPILHKHRKRIIGQAISLNQKAVCFEVPLLYEKGLEMDFDYVIVTICPLFLQKRRALKRKNMDPKKLKNIMEKQNINLYKKKKVDCIVNTGIGRNNAIFRIKKFITSKLKK